VNLFNIKQLVAIIPFDSQFKTTPNISKTKITTIITNYLKNVYPSELGVHSVNLFFDQSSPNIQNIFNDLTNKYSDYTRSPVIGKILDFRKIQNMLGIVFVVIMLYYLNIFLIGIEERFFGLIVKTNS
jgi:hypothetical protein